MPLSIPVPMCGGPPGTWSMRGLTLNPEPCAVSPRGGGARVDVSRAPPLEGV